MEVDTSSATTWRVVNIIKEECIKVGTPVEEALICCVLKMIYDNPKNGFDSDFDGGVASLAPLGLDIDFSSR